MTEIENINLVLNIIKERLCDDLQIYEQIEFKHDFIQSVSKQKRIKKLLGSVDNLEDYLKENYIN